jgi:hypothetical protein
MKKILCILAMLATIVVCLQAEPDFSVSGGKTLDSYWDAYFKTKQTSYLDRIIECVDADDALLASINDNYADIKKNPTVTEFLCGSLGMTDDGKAFSSLCDAEILCCALLHGQNFVEQIRSLYAYFPQSLLVRGAIKSSAFWSLNSNALQHEDVRAYLDSQLPKLKEKTVATFAVTGA